MFRTKNVLRLCMAIPFVLFLLFLVNHWRYKITEPIIKNTKLIQTKNYSHENMKFILIWTHPNVEPISYLGKGQKAFVEKDCPVKSCFVTSNRDFFNEITEFEAIVFHGPEIVYKLPKMPSSRSIHQKYVFASMESSGYYPVCDVRFEGYFNWTWTYKLNSDVENRYIAIRNKEGAVIGPKFEMNWLKLEEMDPVPDEMKIRLRSKIKLAAWFVSNCKAPSGRDKFVSKVQTELSKYGFTVDVYGNCGNKICPRDDEKKCFKIIERDYFFYFVLENSFSEDYVTEKLLNALKNYAIPVVFGAANYSRFMPEGIYLNGRSLGAKGLARKMLEIYEDQEKFLSYFKWHNHYSYHSVDESWETDSVCKFCSALHNEELMSEHTVYEHFKSWWNPPGNC